LDASADPCDRPTIRSEPILHSNQEIDASHPSSSVRYWSPRMSWRS